MTLTLYYTPNSCSLASHIALEEAGADYEAVRIDGMAGEHRREPYLSINPKARIPALLTERGVLTETVAILAYVAQRFPAAGLAPLDDPFAFAEAQAFNAYMASTVHVAHSMRHRGYRWTDDEAAQAALKAKVPETVAACFAMIEERMLKGPWVLGEAYSICDPYLFTIAGWLAGDGVDRMRFPKVDAHWSRVAERPAVRKVLALVNA